MIEMSERDLKVYEQYNAKYVQKFGSDVPIMVLLVKGKFDSAYFVEQVDRAIKNNKPIEEETDKIY